MEEIIYADELIDIAGELGIGLITIDEEFNIVSANDRGRPFLKIYPDKVKALCPHSFSEKTACRSCFLGKNVFCRLSRDGRYRHIFIKTENLEEHTDSLLKESERFKRVLLDNINTSFLILDRDGEVERAHFVGELSILLGPRGLSSSLDKIFTGEIKQKILSKAANVENEKSRDMSHFRFELNSQVLWLDFYIVSMGKGRFFLNIEDKTGEHYLLERLDKLSEVETSCGKVDEIGDKVSNLVSGILGYAEMAISKSDNPAVSEILNSMRKISSDSLNHLRLIKEYTSSGLHGGGMGGRIPNETAIADTSLYVDRDKALYNLENNRDLYNTVITDFITDYSDVPERLPELYDNERDEAQILVHSIKGVAGIIGAFTLQHEANILEGYLRKDEWKEAEDMIPRFNTTLGRVIEELQTFQSSGDREEETSNTELSSLSLDSHQKELLLENLPLAEAGDYNGLMTNLKNYSSFDWGDDWNRAVHHIREFVETIDFDEARSVIKKLVH